MHPRIELLAAHHRREAFDCGEPALNGFLAQQAGQLSKKGFGKTYVALGDDGVQVRGYVTLSAGQVETQRLPPGLKLLRYPAPVLRLGRLAVDRHHQGAGLGRQLMSFALQVALEFSETVGIYAVLVDAKNEQARCFYLSLGFMATLDNPLCLFLPIATLHKASALSQSGG